MVELEHKMSEPDELKKFRKKNPNSRWDDENFLSVKEKVRKQLETEQEGYCVYCEMLLSDETQLSEKIPEKHIEHIKPKSLYPDLTFEYGNLAVSCGNTKHCGHKKGKQEIPLEPRPGCNQYFTISIIDGYIIPCMNLDENCRVKANNTIEILALNCPELASLRKSYVDQVITPNESEASEEISSFIISSPFRWMLIKLFNI